MDLWLKEVDPSSELRKWFGHKPFRWKQFRERYWTELKPNKDSMELLKKQIKKSTVTFIYAARDEEHHGAVALKEFLEQNGG